MKPNLHYVTAESVRCGHPDKLCDQIADRILDAYLAQDRDARVAVEVMASKDCIFVAGEVSSSATVQLAPLVTKTLVDIGYYQSDLGNKDNVRLFTYINTQSPDIAQAVKKQGSDELGAGDQGIVVGYATDETREYMPIPVVLAHKICRELDRAYQMELIPGLCADGKAQVTVLYNGDQPVGVETVVVSFQHREGIDFEEINRNVKDMIVLKVLPENLVTENTQMLINPSGRFIKGGPAADTGLTGRKLGVDLYGPIAHIGAGALSGKDPTKTDRSGAYAARWVAMNIVAAGLANRCEVQISYAIGKSEPVSVDIETFGTGVLSGYVIENAVREVFDLRPAAIIKALDLKHQFYQGTAVYGHMGRADMDMPWERTDKSRELAATAIRQNAVIEAAPGSAEVARKISDNIRVKTVISGKA